MALSYTLQQLHDVAFFHIKGHGLHSWNEPCDDGRKFRVERDATELKQIILKSVEKLSLN